MTSLKSLPAVNFTVFTAAISIGSPVLGFRPVRAARSVAWNSPKPINWTESPSATLALTVRSTASRTLLTVDFGASTDSETMSTMSCLFKVGSLTKGATRAMESNDSQAERSRRGGAAPCAVSTAPSRRRSADGARNTTRATASGLRSVLGVLAVRCWSGCSRGPLVSVLWSVPVAVPAVPGAVRSSSRTWWTWTMCSHLHSGARTQTRTFNHCVGTATWARPPRTFPELVHLDLVPQEPLPRREPRCEPASCGRGEGCY